MARQTAAMIEAISQLYNELPDQDHLDDPSAIETVLTHGRRRLDIERSVDISEGTMARYAKIGERFMERDGGRHYRDLCDTDCAAVDIIRRFADAHQIPSKVMGGWAHTAS